MMKVQIRLLLLLLGLMPCLLMSYSNGNSIAPLRSVLAAEQDQESDLKLKVVDKSTKRPIKNTDVEIYSDNGIRCIQAPCPTNGKRWQGKTNAKGVVSIPASLIQNSMTITAVGYSRGKELNRDAKKLGKRSWVILLEHDR
jgi:hypothetical protein